MDKFKLSYKDLRLLELLDVDSRSSLGFLAKELGLSKQAVRIKINGFIQKKIVLYYPTIINFFNMGYNNLHLYLMLQGIDKKVYAKKLDEIKKINEIAWVAEFFGESNLGISLFYKDLMELSQTLNKVNSILGHFIIKKEFYLIKEQFISRINLVSQNLNVVELCYNKKIDISELDFKIILKIKNNARYDYIDLATSLKKKPETIKRHILSLQNNGIIKSHKILLNYNSLGYLWNLCILNINSGSDLKLLLGYFKKEKRIPFFSVTIENNIIIDFLSRDYQELKEFLNDLKEKNKEIQSYKILNVENLIKLV